MNRSALMCVLNITKKHLMKSKFKSILDL